MTGVSQVNGSGVSAPSPPKKSDLLPRLLVAVVGVPVLVSLCTLAPNWAIWLFYSVVACVGTYEVYAMTMKHMGVGGAIGILATFATLSALYWGSATSVYGMAALSLLALMILSMRADPLTDAGPRMAYLTFGWLYMVTLFGSLLWLAMANGDERMMVAPLQAGWFLFPMFVIWFGDTGAYFAGRAFGKHKLAPRLSPKKTWEGAVGGAVASVVGGFVAWGLFFSASMPWWHIVVLAVPGAILGQIGDLAESLLKRSSGVKDSGRILYGHGGVLDRMDALLFAAPYFAIAKTLLNH
ncbi:MAG: phosphatidate cytidylyltransferase [Bradymonadia bacterium]